MNLNCFDTAAYCTLVCDENHYSSNANHSMWSHDCMEGSANNDIRLNKKLCLKLHYFRCLHSLSYITTYSKYCFWVILHWTTTSKGHKKLSNPVKIYWAQYKMPTPNCLIRGKNLRYFKFQLNFIIIITKIITYISFRLLALNNDHLKFSFSI